MKNFNLQVTLLLCKKVLERYCTDRIALIEICNEFLLLLCNTFNLLLLSQLFKPLLGRTESQGRCEQPLDCLIVQNRQSTQSMGRSMDWTLEDNMVDGLFFCATLTGRRGGHTPFVQAGAETSDTGAEAVKPDSGSSWEGHSGGFRG